MDSFNNGQIQLHYGDCLDIMPSFPVSSIDFVLTDLPYGTTQCKWDIIIPFTSLWPIIDTITSKAGIIALFGTEPFSSLMRLSNLTNYRYDWVWVKDKATNHLNAKKQPMRKTENISIFYKKFSTYNPQLSEKSKDNIRPPRVKRTQTDIYGKMDVKSQRSISVKLTYPNNILPFNGMTGGYKRDKTTHPTQKPVPLLEYLIKTYTDEGDVVLDFTMGSGSTAIACLNTNRRFIGIEKDEGYYTAAVERIRKAIEDEKPNR